MTQVDVSEELYKKFAMAITPKHLELRLFATEKCNFRCVYCYEDFELGRMPQWLRDGIKNLMRKRAESGLESLYISWFGGEPLLALEVIQEIEEYRITLAKEYPSLRCAPSGITTNAYLLTPDVLKRLVDLGVRSYQITLDGPEEHHNKTRLRADGAGTYDVIMQNLLSASQTNLDFSIDIRMHLHKANIDAVRDELTNILIKNFSHDRRFNLHPISVGDFGGAFSDGHVESTTYAIAETTRANILSRYAESPTNPRSSMATDERPKSKSEGALEVCYAAAANSFAIRADGRIVKCTTALDDPRNNIGTIDGSGTLKLDTSLIKLWMVGFHSGKSSELGCPLYKVQTLANPSSNRNIIPIVSQ